MEATGLIQVPLSAGDGRNGSRHRLRCEKGHDNERPNYRETEVTNLGWIENP
jgi:hypothetical protein